MPKVLLSRDRDVRDNKKVYKALCGLAERTNKIRSGSMWDVLWDTEVRELIKIENTLCLLASLRKENGIGKQ